MKTKILALLRENEGEYVSGQEICEKLGVSRTAVWKAVGKLKEEGYEIASVSRKGYRLLASPDVISKEELTGSIQTEWAAKNLICLPVTDSTNMEAARQAEAGAVHGTLITAEMQTAGKGRRGRSWTQEPGTMIAMSLILRPKAMPDSASVLTLAAAHAVAGGIEELCGLPAKIKWPNDVVVHGKKVCGILTEMSVEMDEIRYVVVGIGINTNIENFPEELRDTATSLYLEKGIKVSRVTLIARIMEKFEADYASFLRTGNADGFMEDYNAHLINQGAQVKVLDPKGEFTGVSQGINAQGELLVKREDGRMEQVYAGEVSVRGLYGYV